MSVSANLRRRLAVALADTGARDELVSSLGFFTFGTTFYVDANSGNANNNGLSTDQAKKLVSQAFALVTDGAHDVIVMSANAAHAIASTLVSNVARVHFMGSGGNGRWEGQRTRWEATITSGSGIAMLTNTAMGVTFTNIKFRDSSTNSTNLYCVADGGESTIFRNCAFEKATDLGEDGSSELVCNSDTSLYIDCSFGNGIYVVTGERATVRFTAGLVGGGKCRSVRFVGCLFEMKTSDANSSCCLATIADIERHCIMEDCIFWSSVLSAATQTVVWKIASALTQGMVLLKDCTVLNITGVCATSLGVYTNSGSPAVAGTEAILVAAS